VSLHTLDAIDAARAIREKVLSPVDLIEALLERIERIDGRIQAWALVDREGARRAARQAADEAARGTFRGVLHGVPFGAKDIFYSAGLRTEAGSKTMAGFVPDYDATSVARLKAAGAILLGKLHTTEFATTDPAPTRNPWNLVCTPGGSSSGSAAAVAARMVPLAFGTQTIGSNVRPASYCGLVGLKPTFGRISTRGVIPLSYTQDHVGLIARCVEDIALALSVAAGRDPGDASSSRVPVGDYVAALTRRRAPRVGLLREFFERATPEVTDVTGQAINRLARGGADIEEAKLPPTFRAVAAACEHGDPWGFLRARAQDPAPVPPRDGPVARALRRAADADHADPGARGHGDGRRELPAPVVDLGAAIDHRAVRPDEFGFAAGGPAHQRPVHRGAAALGGGVVRGYPRPRVGAEPLA